MRRFLIQRQRPKYAHVWPIEPSAMAKPPNWLGWPHGKRFAFVLTHDVETEKGKQRCMKLMRLDQKYGFRASFNFVPLGYRVEPELRKALAKNGFEVGVHGLTHDCKLYNSRKLFLERAAQINRYLKDWEAVGFRSPAMHHNLEWLLDLDIEYDASTFDTDPFEPQPDGVGTIFPFYVNGTGRRAGYVELPYTLPQDHTLFILFEEKTIDVWKKKLDWIVAHGGMALMDTHPDYMNFNDARPDLQEYRVALYEELLRYVRDKYRGQFWNATPKEVARYYREQYLDALQPVNEVASQLSGSVRTLVTLASLFVGAL